MEWLSLDERREQDAAGGKKLKVCRGVGLITGNCYVMGFISLLGDRVT